MVIDNHTAAKGEVNKKCYGCETLFHQQNKDNSKKADVIIDISQPLD